MKAEQSHRLHGRMRGIGKRTRLGGGRIRHDPGQKYIKVYGYSMGKENLPLDYVSCHTNMGFCHKDSEGPTTQRP